MILHIFPEGHFALLMTKIIAASIEDSIVTALYHLTALFNNMRTLKFKAQPTNAFFATVNQLFGGSSQLPTMLSKRFDLITARSAVVGSWEEPPNI